VAVPPAGQVEEKEGNSMMQFVERCYRLLIRVSSNLQSPFLLAVRLYWGWQFMQTGWGKLNDMGKVISFFTDLGIPAPVLNAYFVSALEFGGGILLILGVGSRLIALPLVIDMIVAYFAADREALFSIFSNPDKFMGAAPFTFLIASSIVLTFGAGKISLDALLAGRMSGSQVDRTVESRPPDPKYSIPRSTTTV
jgi:putative oxidoreductase